MAKGVMGRPTTGGPVVVVEVDGLRAGWVDGQLAAGDKALRWWAEIAAYCGKSVSLTLPCEGGTRAVQVVSDLSTPIGAIAALCAYAPSRSIVRKGPVVVENV